MWIAVMENGQGLVGYGLILVVIVVIAILAFLGPAICNIFKNTDNRISLPT